MVISNETIKLLRPDLNNEKSLLCHKYFQYKLFPLTMIIHITFENNKTFSAQNKYLSFTLSFSKRYTCMKVSKAATLTQMYLSIKLLANIKNTYKKHLAKHLMKHKKQHVHNKNLQMLILKKKSIQICVTGLFYFFTVNLKL